MNNRVGLGVFGTFGEPHGYQQVLYYDVNFAGSLDLDEDEIEFYSGNDLFAVRREIVDGVYTICFCIYSFVRELNTERFGTFIGTTIVLQDGYAEADYIYRALRNLHDNVLSEKANIENDILVAQQASDVVVKESEDLVALRANTIPISKTPFFSAAVHEGRKFFVTPNPLSEDTREQQVINFFEKALKDYNDTDSLYFSFDRGVYEFVEKSHTIDVTDWDEFMEYRSQAPAEAVVLTKKGIHRPPPGFDTDDKEETIKNTPAAPINTEQSETNRPQSTLNTLRSAEQTAVDEDIDDDPFKPFNLWDEPVPPRGWNQEEAKSRANEYNRLFRYTNTLLEHINEPASENQRKREKRRKQRSEQVLSGEAIADETGEEKPKRKRPPFWLLLIGILVVGGAAVFVFSDDGEIAAPTKTTTIETPAAVQDPALSQTDTLRATPDSVLVDTPTAATTASEDEIAPMQPIARVPTTASTSTNTVSPTPVTPQTASQVVATQTTPAKNAPLLGTVTAPAPPPASNPLMLKESAIYQKAKDLHPRPNMEMMQTDIAILKEMGVKNKTLSELTRMLFENVPSNIGNIYKGQELEYGAAILSANRQSFKLYGSEYVCVNDAIALRIPAYKSPRLPAVYPK
ncbi:MAG: hypothetical protein KF744_16510 [Taibaiella sp.]|nr:hypothetical protein [Taibaiella sp.]